eukprot:7802305-Pyramimonas_sp.AAC.1
MPSRVRVKGGWQSSSFVRKVFTLKVSGMRSSSAEITPHAWMHASSSSSCTGVCKPLTSIDLFAPSSSSALKSAS